MWNNSLAWSIISGGIFRDTGHVCVPLNSKRKEINSYGQKLTLDLWVETGFINSTDSGTS
jgi:hypothetical protein